MTRPRTSYEYPPIVVSSPSGVYTLKTARISALSSGERAQLEGAASKKGGFLRAIGDFLFNQDDSAVLVQTRDHTYRDTRMVPAWQQQFKSASPWAAFIDDDGACALLFADDTLLFFSPSGEPLASVNVLQLLIAEPTAEPHLQRTTAGLFWTRTPIGYFAPTKNGPRFCLPFVYTRLQVDPLSGNHSFSESDPQLDAFEKEVIASNLGRSVQQRDWLGAGQWAELAGAFSVHNAAEALVTLEQNASDATSSSGDSVWAYKHSAPRRAAQQALAQLNVPFAPSNAYAPSPLLESPLAPLPQSRPENWSVAVMNIQPGTKPAECVHFAGSPMFVGIINGTDVWEYDVYTNGGYQTVRLVWRNKRVESLNVYTDPPWKHSAYRRGHF